MKDLSTAFCLQYLYSVNEFEAMIKAIKAIINKVIELNDRRKEQNNEIKRYRVRYNNRKQSDRYNAIPIERKCLKSPLNRRSQKT